MRRDAQDQLVMVGRVVDYQAENADVVQASEVAREQTATVTTQYGRLSGAQGTVARRTKALTEAGKKAKANLLELLPALLGPLNRVAGRLADDDLLASTTLSNKQLRRLRPLALLGVVGSVMGSAARADVAPELAKQGLTAAVLQPLHDALDGFRTAQPAPRKAIDTRTLANADLDQQMGDLMDALRELDQDMKAFKLINRPIYDGYVQMRKVISTGSRGGAAPETPEA